MVSKSLYDEFSGKNEKANPDHFYERLKAYAIGSLAMREVFNMESSVRLAAIRNLGETTARAAIMTRHGAAN